MNRDMPEFADPEELIIAEWLRDDPYAVECWNLHAPEFARVGVLTQVDLPLLWTACERWSLYRRASKILIEKKHILTVPMGSIEVPCPELKIAQTALDSFYKLISEFGAGPGSRSRVKVNIDKGKQNSATKTPFGKFLEKRSQATG